MHELAEGAMEKSACWRRPEQALAVNKPKQPASQEVRYGNLVGRLDGARREGDGG